MYDFIVLYEVSMLSGEGWGLLQVRIYVIRFASLCIGYLEV